MSLKHNPKYVFIAGGIGITPFRSIIKNLVDTKRKEEILLLYSAGKKDAFLFRELFDEVGREIGLTIIYIHKHIDENILRSTIADPSKPLYYLSGPQQMVEAYCDMLEKMGVPLGQIKTDLFTGYDDHSRSESSIE